MLGTKLKKKIREHVFLSTNNYLYVIKIINKNKLLAMNNNIYCININDKIYVDKFIQIISN
jgi:hypothetical protein